MRTWKASGSGGGRRLGGEAPVNGELRMMPENEFWPLIDEANKDFKRFCLRLETMDKSELEAFVWRFEDLAEVFCDDDYLDCIVDSEESISDDALEDLCGWIVGRGKEIYAKAVEDPETMPTRIDDDAPGIAIKFEALRIYHERFGEHLQPK